MEVERVVVSVKTTAEVVVVDTVVVPVVWAETVVLAMPECAVAVAVRMG